MPIETYLIYLATVAVFFATPPDTSQLLMISNATRHGLRRSLWTMGGDLSANALQMTAAAFGLTAIIATSATAFLWIKWIGVAYLAWIGLTLLLRRDTGRQSAPPPAGQLYRQGFFTSLANPFAVVFFGALFPQFIDPGLPVWPQLLILGATYILVDGLILLAWGWGGSRALHALGRMSLHRVNQICGAMMLAAAALLAGKGISPGAAE